MTVSMNQMSDCHWMHRSMIDYMGYTMRTEEFRYTEWVSQSPPACYVQYSDSVTDGGLAPEPCSLLTLPSTRAKKEPILYGTTSMVVG